MLAQLVGNDCNFLNMIYNQHELFVIIRDRLLTVHVGVETLPLSLRIRKLIWKSSAVIQSTIESMAEMKGQLITHVTPFLLHV